MTHLKYILQCRERSIRFLLRIFHRYIKRTLNKNGSQNLCEKSFSAQDLLPYIQCNAQHKSLEKGFLKRDTIYQGSGDNVSV
jgi:hypothetical protein